MSFELSFRVFLISLMQSVNGAQFLNIIALFLSSVHSSLSFAPDPIIVLVPLINMQASL